MSQHVNDRQFNHGQRGFTLVELLVAMTLTSIVMALVLSSIFSLRDHYFGDMVRTRINSNLRSAMDVMSMNVRQAGEHVPAAFPAVEVTNGADGGSDVLYLRRSPITEILTLCENAPAGSTALYVSSSGLANAECVPTNVTPVFTAFQDEMTQHGDNYRVYIYDRATRHGQFVDYVSGGSTGGQYYLTVSGTSMSFSQVTTSIYVLEEFQFSRNDALDRLELTINRKNDEPRPVAFDITDFQVALQLEDGSTVDVFTQNDTVDWKDIQNIELTLTGRGQFSKGGETTSTITSRFLPRNVLSYEAHG